MENKNNWTTNNSLQVGSQQEDEDEGLQTSKSPIPSPVRHAPLKSTYQQVKPAMSPKARRQMVKRSPYTNTLQIVSEPGSRPSPVTTRKQSPPSLGYSDHRRRVAQVRQLSPTIHMRLMNSGSAAGIKTEERSDGQSDRM